MQQNRAAWQGPPARGPVARPSLVPMLLLILLVYIVLRRVKGLPEITIYNNIRGH